MRIEIIIILVAGLIIANIYTDGKYLKKLLTFKKYYKMAGVAFGALMLYLLIKYNPLRAQQIVSTTNDYLKYLPIDKNTSDMISPILDFTSKQNFAESQYSSLDGGNYNYPIIPMPESSTERIGENRMRVSGKTSTKRSVSETKKKFVASRQNWCCGKCKKQLSAWFEVDHVKRLEYGGSNHVDNLVALCRECHGEKTAMENL
jgi:hypothetical protein